MKRSKWINLVKAPGMAFYVREGRNFEKYILVTAYATGSLYGGTFRRAGVAYRNPLFRYFPCEMLYTAGKMCQILWTEELKRKRQAQRRKHGRPGHDTGGR